MVFGGGTGTVSVRGPLSHFGPCIHSCSPSVKQIARLKDESFVFNLKKEIKPTKGVVKLDTSKRRKRQNFARHGTLDARQRAGLGKRGMGSDPRSNKGRRPATGPRADQVRGSGS
jgi:hypothetical protein